MSRPVRLLITHAPQNSVEPFVQELRMHGYDVGFQSVRTEEDFKTALSKPWDVVLASFSLAGFSGLDAFTCLKGSGVDIPLLLLMTERLPEDAIVQLLRAGISDCVPMENPAQLLPAMERVLSLQEFHRKVHRIEGQLRLTRERQNLILKSIPAVLYTAQAKDGRRTWISQNSQAVTGFSVAELANPDFDWWKRVHPEDRDRLESVRQLSEKTGNFCAEYRWQSADGQYHWFLDEAVPLPESGEWTGLLLDITGRKKAEEQEAGLEKFETLGRMVSSIANDLNNYLAVVGGHAEELIGQAGISRQTAESLRQMKLHTDKASGVVRGLLSQVCRLPMTPYVFDLAQRLAGLRNSVQQLAGSSIDIQWMLPPHPLSIDADPEQIDRAILNLVIFARESMPLGGRLTVELSEGDGRTKGLKEGPWVWLEMSDTGIGFDSEREKQLFEPFYGSNFADQMSGLGLNMVRNIVLQSGGRIIASSRPGKGARFCMCFPRADASQKAKSVPLVSVASKTVLVVDDEPEIRNIIIHQLERNGANVLVANDGISALEEAKAHNGIIHLLMTDIRMPRMDGFHLAGEIRRLSPATRVLYMSGYADPDEVKKEIRERKETILQKPFTRNELYSALSKVMGNKSAGGPPTAAG